MNKPIVIFTNFSDAKFLYGCDSFIVEKNGKKFYIKPNQEPTQYSIALNFLEENFRRLNILTPNYKTWKLLRNEKTREEGYKQYIEKIFRGKDNVLRWTKSLIPEKIYLICSFENTLYNKNEYRRHLYRFLSSDDKTKNKALYVYRDGAQNFDKSKKDETDKFIENAILESANGIDKITYYLSMQSHPVAGFQTIYGDDSDEFGLF